METHRDSTMVNVRRDASVRAHRTCRAGKEPHVHTRTQGGFDAPLVADARGGGGCVRGGRGLREERLDLPLAFITNLTPLLKTKPAKEKRNLAEAMDTGDAQLKTLI